MPKINISKKSEDDVIDLRGSHKNKVEIMDESDEEPEFQINSMEDDDSGMMGPPMKASPIREADIAELKTTENVRVKFDKFASLVAAHATKEFIERSRDEDVIVTTNLLTDLANSGKGDEGKKIPMVFLIGIILGIGLAWLLLKS